MQQPGVPQIAVPAPLRSAGTVQGDAARVVAITQRRRWMRKRLEPDVTGWETDNATFEAQFEQVRAGAAGG